MQSLVYSFIALAALGIAATAYFGLSFSPIEAFVTAVAFASGAIVLLERVLRRRAEARLERAIEDLARLLSTDAQAGAVLSQRINAIADTDAGSRLEAIEADISVLGTVIRQVAEAVADLEEERRNAGPAAPPPAAAPERHDEDSFPEPVVPAELLREAIAEGRIVCHVEPVVTLPQRRPHGYDIVPRLQLDDGDFADAPDFMPRRGDDDAVRRIEALMLDEAIAIARRTRTAGHPTRLFVPLSRVSTGDAAAAAQLLAALDANRAIADALSFAITEADWKALAADDRAGLAGFARAGATFSLTAASSLRHDFGELETFGFSSVRIDATRFLRDPGAFTDFHTGDVAPFVKRYHIDIVATGIIDEQQLLTFFEDGILLVQGPHISAPGPVPDDLLVERPVAAVAGRRAAAP